MDFIKALIRQYWVNLLALAVFGAAVIRCFGGVALIVATILLYPR